MLCDECKNKVVCKWVELIKQVQEYYESTDKSAPIKITLECIKRRVK